MQDEQNRTYVCWDHSRRLFNTIENRKIVTRRRLHQSKQAQFYGGKTACVAPLVKI